MSESFNQKAQETPATPEPERPFEKEGASFSSYWQEVAEAYPEAAEVCLSNARRMESLREGLFESSQAPESFNNRTEAAKELYLSYGSFNSMKGAEMDMARLAQIFLGDEQLEIDTANPSEFLSFVEEQTSERSPSEMKMLAGCCLYEMGVMHENIGVRSKLLLSARDIYKSITDSDASWSSRYKEEAHQYQGDIEFYLLTNRPNMSSQEYQQAFVHSQIDQLKRLQNIIDEGVSTGFLWEEYYQLSVRRLLWEGYSADQVDISTSLPRQDMPHDKFAPNGLKKQAFDAVVSAEGAKSFLQLKAYKDPGSEEAYIDDIDIVDVEGEGLRRKIQNELVAIEMAYGIEGRNLRREGSSARREIDGDVKSEVAESLPSL